MKFAMCNKDRPKKKYEAFGEADGEFHRMESDKLEAFKDFIKELD